MGIRRVWVIRCDRAHCPEIFIAERDKMVGARGEAKEQGWQYRPRGALWFCPAHTVEQDDEHESWCPAVTRYSQCRCKDNPSPPLGNSDTYMRGSTVTVRPPGDIL